MNYNWKKMIATNLKTGIKVPMRIDTEGMMVDIWNTEINEWCWSDDATAKFIKAFKK